MANCKDHVGLNEEAYRFFKVQSNLYYHYVLTQNTFLRAGKTFYIDSTFNRKIFAVETDLSYLTLTFVSCHLLDKITKRGTGFRVIVSKQVTPACTSLSNFADGTDDRFEYCHKPSMSLSSMSYFNIPITKRTEKWTVNRKRGFFRIDIVQFDVRCNTETKFAVNEKTYCNLDMPAYRFSTSSNHMTVLFRTANPKDSFRLIYTNIFDTIPDTITQKAADIPAIHRSVLSEAYMAEDHELREMFLKGYLGTYTVSNLPRLLYKACSEKFKKCYSIFSNYGTWNFAGGECWIRRQRLVSIGSEEELKLIKYLLRNFKLLFDTDSELFESAFRHNKTDFYNTYIGLRRKERGSDKNAFFWEDRTPATFSAWAAGEPSSGDCTRMGFYKANVDFTWETHNCLSRSAFYFVCENVFDNTSEEITDRLFSTQYAGNVSVTESGITCQRWDSQYPHKHHFNKDIMFPEKSISDAENFCRDPSESQILWCLTTNPSVEWAVCRLNELQEDVSPAVYSGYLDKTSYGTKCKKWENKSHNYCLHANNYFVRELYRSLWCYADVKGEIRPVVCNFKDTASDRCLNVFHWYRGTWNFTVSGEACQRWDMFYSQEKFDEYQFCDCDLEGASNYCRDPTGKGFQWCFIRYPGTMWEICAVNHSSWLEESRNSDTATTWKYFECGDGQRVDAYKHCNGVIDCSDFSDEVNCTATNHPLLQDIKTDALETNITGTDSVSLFRCTNQELISFLSRCDGVLDCQDASDEINCSNVIKDNVTCAEDQFKCGDGKCIHVSLVCNVINDCIDLSDELCDYPPCSPDEYTCANGQCIQLATRCNAYPDCLDGTDENNCESCSSSAFHCDYVRCVPNKVLCDKYPDCVDGADETSCDKSVKVSCKDWWDNGYRKSGIYTVYSATATNVFCDFDSVWTQHQVHTLFPNVDVMKWDGKLIIYSAFIEETPADLAIDFYFNTDGRAYCTQEIVQSCNPVIEAISATDDPDYEHMYSYCVCLTVTLVIGWTPEISSVKYCNSSIRVPKEDIDDVLLFEYKYTTSHRTIEWKNVLVNFENIHLKIGNITCKEELHVDRELPVGCAGGTNVYDASVRCLYDVDSTGFIKGCRSGSHLQSCDVIECPKETVKCPDSYCLPLKFLCDGVEHCPNAEDEFGCGCEDEEKEVLIVHEKDAVRGPDFAKLVKQLHTPKSILRSIEYSSLQLSVGIPFLHRLLKIKDKEMKAFELTDRNFECEYNLLANEFLKTIKFTKLKKAILFIQSSPESELIAKLMFENMTEMIREFTVYRAIESPSSVFKDLELFPFVMDVVVKDWNVLSSLASRYLPDICREAFSTTCPGFYKCSSSKMCITRGQICDGIVDCIHGDDELLCDFVCPKQCICRGFEMTCNVLNETGIRTFPKRTRSLTLSKVGEMETSLSKDELDFPFLYLLNFSSCKIKDIQSNTFSKLINLRVLDLSNNLITKLSPLVFSGLQRLHTLMLDGNSNLASLESFTFQYLKSVKILKIAATKLITVVSNTFAGLNLELLDLQNNNFQYIEEFGLGNLAVEHISFEKNIISSFDKGMFTGVSGLKTLQTPAYKYCCVRPSYVPEESCFPQKDEFSSCEDLMRISVLQTMLWLIGLCALLGNTLSFIYRLKFDRERLKLGYGIFVTNLAVADFLMGIYLIIIAVADAVFRKRYIFMDDYWRNSIWCTLAGVLSTLSSEASVIFICLITLDRLLVIKYPFGQVRFNTKKAAVFSVATWILCLIISLFPLMYTAYFRDSFYNKSGVCIALPLTRDRPPGWLYSVLIFVLFNFITFLLIAIGQWSVYMDIRTSGKRVTKAMSGRRRDLVVAKNLLLVVTTDFLCWFPIGCIGLMAMSGHVISGDVYAWAAVFILPVNSALNPMLYTLTAILGKKNFMPRTDEQAKKKLKTALGKRFLINKCIVMRRFYVEDSSSENVYKSLAEILAGPERLPLDVVLKISYQLAQTLQVLHSNSLMLGKIEEQSLYIKIAGNKIQGDVQLHQEPNLCRQPTDTSNDMYKFGLLMRTLLRKSLSNKAD
ncbi:uncharacterized protein LOC123533444 [Mercenaria mercenaria]|uniref:uncharacterized protein LOC123533444 n=1 Tax=Mercenaria mercenaria TaxID=6596 RepID=UPI00234F3CC4|nr:uncharacterized protein LOC123533444 [Mercenaria mercenaria]